MAFIDEHGRPRPPEDSGELETLLGFLDYQRATFEWKCSDLDSTGMGLTVASSPMSLGGMMKHLALVEEHWFSRRLLETTRQQMAGIEPMQAEDIADAISFIVTRARHVAVNEILIRPTEQE